MTVSAQEALSRVAGSFADTRTQYCRLELSAWEGGTHVISGAVLDRATLDAVLDEMRQVVAGFAPDTSQVRVLEATSSPANVGVNLTGLFAQPSWLAEQISQLLNGWPLEVLFEEGNWRFVRLSDGYLGWTYGPYLAPPSACPFTHLVCRPEMTLLAEPSADAAPVTRIPVGTAVVVDATEGVWRHLALAGNHSGWIPWPALRAFSALPGDEKARRQQMMLDASDFTGVPYLWGGCTAWGIDCSGFAQLLHRLVGITLPRDADMQYEAGRPVEYPYKPGDLLFFGEAGDPRRITHVAVSRGGWDIIHSSRRINGVYEDNVQAVDGLRDSFVAGRTFLE